MIRWMKANMFLSFICIWSASVQLKENTSAWLLSSTSGVAEKEWSMNGHWHSMTDWVPETGGTSGWSKSMKVGIKVDYDVFLQQILIQAQSVQECIILILVGKVLFQVPYISLWLCAFKNMISKDLRIIYIMHSRYWVRSYDLYNFTCLSKIWETISSPFLIDWGLGSGHY